MYINLCVFNAEAKTAASAGICSIHSVSMKSQKKKIPNYKKASELQGDSNKD